MKKGSLYIFLLLIAASLFFSTGTAFASNGNINSSSLQVALINQNPDAARPGEPVEITVSIQNIGNTDLKNINVQVNPEYPFSKLSGESLEKQVSYLSARQDSKDAAVLKFKLMTDSNASEGAYNLDITTTAKESGTLSNTIATTKTVQLEVRGKEYAQIVTINKASIDLAKEEPLEFIITNTGNSPLKNMVVSWKDPKGVILPVYSDNTKYIKYLEPGQSITVAYSVMADVNAQPGLYTININLSFEDYESNEKNIQTTAGLFVGGETDFDVSFSESDAGGISLSVANVGNNMAYSVKVSIPEQAGYRVTGSSSSIVGNLEKGDYTIASFNVMNMQGRDNSKSETSQAQADTAKAAPEDNLTAASSAPLDSNPLNVQIEYTDAKGERKTVDKEVAIQTNMTASSGNKRGAAGNSSGFGSYLLYIILIALVGAGVFLYRKKKQAWPEKKPEYNMDVKSESQNTTPRQ